MCSDGGKLEVFENLMGMMNITKEKVQQFMMASPGEKEEIINGLWGEKYYVQDAESMLEMENYLKKKFIHK